MNLFKSKAGTAAEPQPDPALNSIAEQELDQALANFRQCVHAWSEAELNRPRTARVMAHSVWRPALAWAMGCVLAAGAAGGVYDHHRHVVERQQAAARLAHQRELAAQQKASESDENLLANVDTDIARSVPDAMEPLAQLMDDDGTQ